jgi:hypothetical protein
VNKFGPREDVNFEFQSLEMIQYWKNLFEYSKELNGPVLCNCPAQVNSTEPSSIWKWQKATIDFLQCGTHQDAMPTAPVAESHCRRTLLSPRSDQAPPHVHRHAHSDATLISC